MVNGTSAIHNAALQGNNVAINICLENNGFLNTTNSDDFTELHFAILSRDEETIRTLLNAGSVPSSLRNEMTCIDIAKHIRSGMAIKMLQSVDSKTEKKGVQSNVANILLSKVKDIKKF